MNDHHFFHSMEMVDFTIFRMDAFYWDDDPPQLGHVCHAQQPVLFEQMIPKMFCIFQCFSPGFARNWYNRDTEYQYRFGFSCWITLETARLFSAYSIFSSIRNGSRHRMTVRTSHSIIGSPWSKSCSFSSMMVLPWYRAWRMMQSRDCFA